MMNMFAAGNTCRVLSSETTDTTQQHMHHPSLPFIKVCLSIWKRQRSELSSGGVQACVKFSYLTDRFYDLIDRHTAGGRE